MLNYAKVIGAGVSGLSTARQLQKAGFKVDIIAADKPTKTTSAAAAGVWMPFHAGDNPLTAQWAKITYDYCKSMLAMPEAGIFFIEHRSYFEFPSVVVDKEIQEADNFRFLKPQELKYGAQSGFTLSAPVMSSGDYLSFLANRFQQAGGNFFWRKVSNIADESNNADLIINCSGFGARDLFNDRSLHAAKGHVVVTDNPGINTNIIVTGKNDFTHIFPYGEQCALGGIYQVDNSDLTPSPKITCDIINRVIALEPAFKDARIYDVRTGLRPYRPAVRLEVEKLDNGKSVIHNYGHGGAGYTLSRGCAENVVALARNCLS